MKNYEQIQSLSEERLSLSSKLEQGDYKVIKCAEAQSIGAEMPYDAAALHAERQAMRDRINAIDAELAVLEANDEEDERGSEREQ